MTHPLCVYHSVIDPTRRNTLGIYTSHSTAAEACARLRSRRHDRLPLIGRTIVSEKRTGRPVDVYYKGPVPGWPKVDNLRHAVKETDFALAVLSAFPETDFIRGPDTGPMRPDLWLVMCDGVRIPVEIDCGTMSERQVLARWLKYLEYYGKILIACAPKYETAASRFHKLIGWGEKADDFNDKAYYVALSSFVKSPEAPLWVDCTLSRGFTLKELWKNP